MREIAIAAVALLLGVLLGGVGPRSELQVFEKQREGRVESAQKCRSGVGRDLAAFMGTGSGRPASTPPAPAPADEVVVEEVVPADGQGTAGEQDSNGGAVMADEIEAVSSEEDEQEGLPSGGGGREIEAARTALELRRTQARAALLEHTDAEDEQLETFDQAVGNMNAVLLGMSDELAEMLESGEEPARRDAMEFAADALDTLLAAEDAMRAAFDEDQLDGLPDSAVDPFSYVDPAIVDVLAQLEKAE